MREFLERDTPLEPARTKAEEKIAVALPGDTHVPARPYGDNPYMNNPFGALEALRSGKLSADQVKQAVQTYEKSTGERVSRDWFSRPKPQELPPDIRGEYHPPDTSRDGSPRHQSRSHAGLKKLAQR